jgi:hypothetical protein
VLRRRRCDGLVTGRLAVANLSSRLVDLVRVTKSAFSFAVFDDEETEVRGSEGLAGEEADSLGRPRRHMARPLLQSRETTMA